jgi:hypothetical protein
LAGARLTPSRAPTVGWSGRARARGPLATRLNDGSIWAAFFFLLALWTLAGCGGPAVEEKPPKDESQEAIVARTTAGDGPVRVTVEVSPSLVRLSDEPTLTVTMEYEPGITVEKPPFGESIGDFLILDFREPLPQVVDKNEVVKQVYTLEPTTTGELTVWPVTVNYTDNRPGAKGQKGTVETEGLTIRVTSMLDHEAPSLTDLKPADGPLELPSPPSYFLWWLLGVGALLAGAGAVAVLIWTGRRRAELMRPPTPQELAQQELQRILSERLVERDVKQFYVELTGVVRRYIERTTGIHAPEQTTEEFLREISTRDTIPLTESRKLQQFLQSADLVKFAGHQPRQEDIDASVERARAFIGISWSPEQAA